MKKQEKSPTRQEAEHAVRVLIRWIGEDETREDLIDTPRRVVDAYREHFSGYQVNVAEELSRSFSKSPAYDDFVLLKKIPFVSHCEHHIAPFYGYVHVAYWPRDRIVGLSKLARVVDVFSRRLQTQENMTTMIALAMEEQMKPLGVAVVVEAEHQCMSMRGVRKDGVLTVTSKFLGVFKENSSVLERFMACIGQS